MKGSDYKEVSLITVNGIPGPTQAQAHVMLPHIYGKIKSKYSEVFRRQNLSSWNVIFYSQSIPCCLHFLAQFFNKITKITDSSPLPMDVLCIAKWKYDPMPCLSPHFLKNCTPLSRVTWKAHPWVMRNSGFWVQLNSEFVQKTERPWCSQQTLHVRKVC